MVKLIVQFYHKFPILCKFDVFMLDFHISGNTGERFFCVIMLIQMNIDNCMTVRKDTAGGKVGDDRYIRACQAAWKRHSLQKADW